MWDTEENNGALEEAIVEGVKELSLLLARRYPPRPGGRNELPDKPAVLQVRGPIAWHARTMAARGGRTPAGGS